MQERPGSTQRRPTLTLKQAQPKKPAAWNHQQDLTAGIGKTVAVSILDVGPVTGRLVAADQFTLKIENPETGEPFIVFKSALTLIGFPTA